MDYQRLASLFAAIMGLVGTIFIAKALLILSPTAMLRLTSPYSRIVYAPEQIESIASQKADSVIGITYIAIAFAIQITSLLFSPEQSQPVVSRWMGFWVVLGIVSVLTVTLTLADRGLEGHYRSQVGKVAIRDYLRDRFTGKVDPVDARSLVKMTDDLLGINKAEEEPVTDFVRRVAAIVQWQIQDSTDLSRLGEEK